MGPLDRCRLAPATSDKETASRSGSTKMARACLGQVGRMDGWPQAATLGGRPKPCIGDTVVPFDFLLATLRSCSCSSSSSSLPLTSHLFRTALRRSWFWSRFMLQGSLLVGFVCVAVSDRFSSHVFLWFPCFENSCECRIRSWS